MHSIAVGLPEDGAAASPARAAGRRALDLLEVNPAMHTLGVVSCSRLSGG